MFEIILNVFNVSYIKLHCPRVAPTKDLRTYMCVSVDFYSPGTFFFIPLAQEWICQFYGASTHSILVPQGALLDTVMEKQEAFKSQAAN